MGAEIRLPACKSVCEPNQLIACVQIGLCTKKLSLCAKKEEHLSMIMKDLIEFNLGSEAFFMEPFRSCMVPPEESERVSRAMICLEELNRIVKRAVLMVWIWVHSISCLGVSICV